MATIFYVNRTSPEQTDTVMFGDVLIASLAETGDEPKEEYHVHASIDLSILQ